MITISLCMIVKDEQEVLARCLDSVAGIVDEIIIVDTGSKDATKEIAKCYTDKIYDFPWVDDFSAARNVSFEKASKEYLLWLDADDVILPKDQKEFLHLKETLDPHTDVVMMPYHVSFDQDGAPTVLYDRERLLRREKQFRWLGAVHEAIPPSGKIVHSSAAVTHRKIKPSHSDRNLKIFEKCLLKRNLDAREQYYYARELYDHKQYEAAIHQLRNFLKREDGWAENKIEACRVLSDCLYKKNKSEYALSALFQSFQWGFPRAEVCCDIGRCFLEQKNVPMAVYWYKMALRAKPVPFGGFSYPDCSGFLPCIQLCVCFFQLGDLKKSYFWHKKSQKFKPDHPAVRQNEAYFKTIFP